LCEHSHLHVPGKEIFPALDNERFAYAFFLDIDGTLVEIAETPDTVRIDTRLPELIERLFCACHGALALISGRSIADIDHLLGLAGIPVAGQHGLERRNAAGIGVCETGHRHSLKSIRAGFTELAERNPALLIEDKGLSLAVHYRRAPQLASYLRRSLQQLVAAYPDLVIQQGKQVVEVKPAGIDKGSAIAAFLSEPPFSGRIPVFAGDDVTDEAGFALVNACRGISIKVGPERSQAHYRFPNVGAVHSWLDRLVSEKSA